jgi:small subunit ribosomal protein S29
MSRVNELILSNITLSQKHNLPLRLGENPTLLQLAEFGAKDLDLAWPLFQAIWSELTRKNTPENEKSGKRPPILLCADNISYLFSPTEYKILAEDGTLKPVHPFDLMLPKHYIDHLTGAQSLPNGGVVLGATSSSNFVSCSPLEVGIRLGEARNSNNGTPVNINDFWSPLVKIDRRVLNEVLDLDVLRLHGLSKNQAREIIEYWALSGLVRDHVKDNYVGQKWALSGGGIIGELEKAVVKSLAAGA